ncbi:hypothetical protein HRbin06_01064 [archaeon HR06]|nr:hypothetical protein HRbin06_01064 [archaeon HR06]
MPQIEGFTLLGIFFILLGIALLLLPLLTKVINLQNLEKIPPLLLYIYKSDGFYFITSPLLLIISLIFLFLYLIR